MSTGFAIGGVERNRVEVCVLCYERALTGEYYDDNWLHVEVSIDAGGFTGRLSAAVLAFELMDFRDQVTRLYERPDGVALFETVEGQLSLQLKGSSSGPITVTGAATDDAGSDNRLAFVLHIDQSYLTSLLRELNAVCEQFPVRAG